MKDKFFLYILFYIFLIKEISSFEEEILNKYGSIKTKYSSMIINTTEFESGDDIFIKLESESNCDDSIRYQFYDNINEIYNQTSDLKFSLRTESRVLTNIMGKKTHLSLYYTINKNRFNLDDSEGNILYIEFKCEGEVEIKNTKTNSKIFFILFAIIIVVIFFIIFCFIFIKGCLYSIICLKLMFGGRTNYNINGIPNTLYMNASPSRVVYIPQNPNINQNNGNHVNQNRNAFSKPQNLQQQINPQMPASTEVMNSTDRNLIPSN